MNRLPSRCSNHYIPAHGVVGRVLLVASLLGFVSLPTSAQDTSTAPASQDLQEITVTAQRRVQSIMDVGINVTALSQQALQEFGVTESTDIANHVPGIVFNGGNASGDQAFLSIRGVSQNDFSFHQESPNAIYTDGVYVASSQAAAFSSYDMQGIEVLRGPQGTLFGRNATGGLMQFITAKPTNELTGYANVEYGSFDEMKFTGAVSGPLNEVLRGRVAVMTDNDDGWFRNFTPGAKPAFNKNFAGVRGELAADLGQNWDVLLTTSYNQDHNRGGAYWHATSYINSNGASEFLPHNVNFYGTGPGADPFGYTNSSNFYSGTWDTFPHNTKETTFTTLNVNGHFGTITFQSISNFNSLADNYQEDCDGTPLELCHWLTSAHQRQWSQELRFLGSSEWLDWTLGMYALGISGDFLSNFSTPYFNGTSYADDLYSPYSQNTHSYSEYGQVEFKLTDRFKAIVGGRLMHDIKSFYVKSYNTNAPTPELVYEFDPATVGDLATQTLTNWQGKFELDYKFSDNTLFYASVNRAIRSGGFNAISTAIIPGDQVPFRSETNIAYELGMKYQAFGGRAFLNLSTFYYDYHNFQAFNAVGFTFSVTNFPARSQGVDLDLSVEPLDGLKLSLGGSFLQANVRDYFVGTVETSPEPVMAPKWTSVGSVRKVWSIGGNDISLLYDFSFVGQSYSSLIESPVTTLPASVIQNFRIGYTIKSENIELYAFCNNLADRARELFSYDITSSFGTTMESYAPPRWFGGGIRWTF